MTKHIRIEITEAQESQLAAMAEHEAKSVDRLVADLLQRSLAYDAWFRAQVQEGIDSADRGELTSHEVVVAEGLARRAELMARKAQG